MSMPAREGAHHGQTRRLQATVLRATIAGSAVRSGRKIVAKSKKSKKAKARVAEGMAEADGKVGKLKKSVYEAELGRLQVELVKLQEYIREKGLRVVVVFEGRDAAGKGGTIKRINDAMNPRVCRIAALPAPSDRERT